MVAPLNRNQEASKKELKKEKSLVIKMISSETLDEDHKDMTCLTRRYQNWRGNIEVYERQQSYKCKLPVPQVGKAMSFHQRLPKE